MWVNEDYQEHAGYQDTRICRVADTNDLVTIGKCFSVVTESMWSHTEFDLKSSGRSFLYIS
jgi:hypothetical protein